MWVVEGRAEDIWPGIIGEYGSFGMHNESFASTRGLSEVFLSHHNRQKTTPSGRAEVCGLLQYIQIRWAFERLSCTSPGIPQLCPYS